MSQNFRNNQTDKKVTTLQAKVNQAEQSSKDKKSSGKARKKKNRKW